VTTFRAHKMKQLHHYSVSHTKERTTTVDVWEGGAEKNVRTIEEGNNRMPNRTVYERLHNLYSSPLVIIVIWTNYMGGSRRKDEKKWLQNSGLTTWRRGGMRWLKHCSTSRKVAGSIPDGVTGIFNWHNHSGRTMAQGSTQPQTKISTRNICWEVKAAGEYGLQPYQLYVKNVLKSRSFNLLELSEPVQVCTGIDLPFFIPKEREIFEDL
jgi:hypothetical protein